MSKTFFTADTHFGHKGILTHCQHSRRYRDIKQHDDAIVANWNSIVKKDDVVYHLGDVCWSSTDYETIRKLNGNKILIPGNHDHKHLKREEFKKLFEEILPSPYHEVNLNDQLIVLCHYPLWEWRGLFRGAWHLHGHVHGIPTNIPGKILDVGLDTNCMTPFSIERIQQEMDKKDANISQVRKSL